MRETWGSEQKYILVWLTSTGTEMHKKETTKFEW